MSSASAPWFGAARDEWLTAVSAWIRDALAVTRRPRVALETLSERPWGAVLGVVTPSERLVFKAMGPLGRHELRLLVDLAARRPGLTPEVVGADEARGWVLMRDHGTPMAETDVAEQVRLVELLLPTYAEMQRTTTDQVEDWMRAGVPARSLRALPSALEWLLAGRGRLGPVGVEHEELAAMFDALGLFRQVCDDLAATAAVDRAIDHADIHGSNVLVGAEGPRLIDWGDSCIGHPFTSLLVPMEWIVGRLPAADIPRAAGRLLDAYLEPWGPHADRHDVARAVWAGYVARALSNDEQCHGGSSDDVAGAQREIATLLRTWLAKSHVLGDPQQLLMPAMPATA